MVVHGNNYSGFDRLIEQAEQQCAFTRGLKDAVFVPRRTDVYSRCLRDEWE